MGLFGGLFGGNNTGLSGMHGLRGLIGNVTDFGGGDMQNRLNQENKKKTQAALGELTPEAMQALIQKFFTQYYAQLNPLMQGAIGKLNVGASRSGLTGAGVTRQLQAGVPGQFANMALGQAVPSAMNVAGQRAGIQANRQYGVPQSGGQMIFDLLKTWLGSGSAGMMGMGK